jgi:hypothetical protein
VAKGVDLGCTLTKKSDQLEAAVDQAIAACDGEAMLRFYAAHGHKLAQLSSSPILANEVGLLSITSVMLCMMSRISL